MTEETLFHLALQQPAAERAAFLEKMCAGDDALRQRVATLLHAVDNPGSFLCQPPVQVQTTVDEAPPATGPEIAGTPGQLDNRIGPYHLLRPLGEGGMGTVFLAEQTEPVQRQVALKVIKPGMDSRQVIARFEAERQALALMDHPNIAKVHDGGTTDLGHPYFVMELVQGVPLTNYCDEQWLTLRQRLELFVPVCRAVQHAHQKGIIHRDLKPSNVLVTLYDGQPVPKVIDFGVAKAMGGQLPNQTQFTGIGAVVGTLEYMSPEQAEPNQVDVDTRADIYALGVMLYELLTGTTPLERKRLRKAALLECLRLIRDEEPPKPSTRLSTVEELPSIAARRGVEAKKLSRLVRGDLDWIVMKCLEKDRDRRYETANGLASDIQRYLADEPVSASPPSAAYRLRKFVRRHKTGLLTAAVIGVVLVLACGGVGWALWERAGLRETQRTEQAKRAAEQAKRAAETEQTVTVALAQAEQSSARAGRLPTATSLETKAALAEWREAEAALAEAEAALKTGVAEDALRGRVAAMRQRLEQGRRQVEQRLAQTLRQEKLLRDLDKARMAHLVIVKNHLDYAGSAAQYAAVFAAYDLDVAKGNKDALARRIAGEEPGVRDALLVALDDWAYAAAEGQTAWSAKELWALAQEADMDAWRQRFRAAVTTQNRAALRALSGEARQSSLPPSSLVLLARSLRYHGERDEALALLRWGRGRHPTDFWIPFELGVLLDGKGAGTPLEVEEALGCYRAALAVRPEASVVHLNLGTTLWDKKQLDEAIAEFREAIRLDGQYAWAYDSLGIALWDNKQWDEAIAEYKKAIKLDPELASAHINLGNALHAKKEWDDAIAEFQQAIKLDRKDVTAHYYLGFALAKANRWDDAVAEFRQAIKLDPKDAKAHYCFGTALWEKKQWNDAIVELRQAIKLDPKYAQAHTNLGLALADTKQWDAAIAEYRQAIQLDPKEVNAHDGLGSALQAKNQLDDAIAEFRLAIKLDPTSVWPHNNLGTALAAKNQLDEAIVEYRKAIKLDPQLMEPHNNLGGALAAKNQLDEAIAEFRLAINLDRTNALLHIHLGLTLAHKNQWSDASAEFRKAIELQPDSAEAHCLLANALRAQGHLTQSLEFYKRGHALGSKRHNWRYPSAQWVADAERLVRLEAKLTDVLAGKAMPADNGERLGLIEVCQLQRRHVVAVRLSTDAFTADPKLADNLKAAHRYHAACFAVLAAAGQEMDADKLDDKERTRLRKQALDWLRADLDLWDKLWDGGQAADRLLLKNMLSHWPEDAELSTVRDPEALKKLPAEEQESWRKLWADVADLLKKSGDAK